MEGPTPVSAMIHAATMVSAGVYLTLRIFPLLAAGMEHGHPTPTMQIVTFIGAFTALFAATIAIAQNDVKRVLAYSTISQLGFMFAAIGIGAYIAAAFHLVMHAFFKALLFLGSGSVIHGVEHGVFHTGEHVDPQDMFNMGGLRKKMPITFITFFIGGLALAGFPLITAGFWSKDEIFADAFGHNHTAVFITLAVAALLTAYYTMRQITLTFLGEPRSKAADHASENVWTMTVPLIILAIFSLVLGWVGIPEDFPVVGNIIPNYAHEFVGETLLEEPKPVTFNFIPLITSIVVSLGGLGLGWLVYRKTKAGAADPQERVLGPVYTLLQNKYYFDELYDLLFVRPAYWVAEKFSYLWMDRKVIDGFLNWVAYLTSLIGNFLRNFIDMPLINGFGDWVGESTKKLSAILRPIQTGRIQQYMILALVTVAAFTALFYYLLVFGR
jgi:NADH-quinone oxidoreductase subunit L